MATLEDRTLVYTEVAIAFAVSWKLSMKSKIITGTTALRSKKGIMHF
jgi:hypothetical protein